MLIKKIIKSFVMWIYYLLPNYPQYPMVYRFFESYRYLIHKKIFRDFGHNSFLRSNVRFGYSKNISIGCNAIIGPNSILNGSSEIVIGDNFLAGPELIIYTAEHGIENNGVPFNQQNITTESVIIGDNVYIGARVIILKGVVIGDNVVIGAGSIITNNLQSNTLYAGVPVKKIKDLK